MGPYHLARITAAASSSPRKITVVELSETTSKYEWDRVESQGSWKRVTVAKEDSDLRSASFRRKLRGILNKIDPEVVFVPGWSGEHAVESIQWCLARKIPAILYSESSKRDAKRRWAGEFLKSKIVRCFSAGLVGGSRHRDYLVDLGIPAEATEFGYDVTDNLYFESKSNEAREINTRTVGQLQLPSQYFLASARFIPKKNLINLVAAFAKFLQTTKSNQHLVLLGDGPGREELTAQSAALGISDFVLMPGFRQYQELPIYYAHATAFIHASTVEQWGLVVNEAMACGLPVLVSEACGCVPELVHEGVNGYSFLPDDVNSLAELLGKLASNSVGCQEMGKQSKRIVSEWGPERFAQGFWDAVQTAENGVPKRISYLDQFLLSIAGWASRFSNVQ